MSIRTFIIKILWSIALFVFVVLTIIYIAIEWQNNKFNEVVKDDNLRSLFIGDSHIQNAVNDELSSSWRNYGMGSENYYFTYYKLLRILEMNPKIKRVYIGFGYHNLSSYMDEIERKGKGKQAMTRYFFLLPRREQFKVMFSNVFDFPSFYKGIALQAIKDLKNPSTLEVVGGFSFSRKSYKGTNDTIINYRIKQQFFTDNNIARFSNESIIYLKKMISLCHKKNIKVNFVNTPISQDYLVQIPNIYIVRYKNLIDSLRVPLIDFSDKVFSNNSFTPGGDHTTQKGAETVSKYLFQNSLKKN